MSQSTVAVGYHVALGLGLGAAAAVLIWWGRKVFPPFLRRRERGAPIALAAIYMMPGMIIAIACCVPAFYFAHLRKQEDYCLELIRVNHISSATQADLVERCGGLDLEQLIRRSGEGTGPETNR
ncbi:MAG TPA: hypothetical protein VKB80_35280 [Kofleriaceae bacterium]|nr:hypothetical protein [Kofleriaceae bacterium]